MQSTQVYDGGGESQGLGDDDDVGAGPGEGDDDVGAGPGDAAVDDVEGHGAGVVAVAPVLPLVLLLLAAPTQEHPSWNLHAESVVKSSHGRAGPLQYSPEALHEHPLWPSHLARPE